MLKDGGIGAEIEVESYENKSLSGLDAGAISLKGEDDEAKEIKTSKRSSAALEKELKRMIDEN